MAISESDEYIDTDRLAELTGIAAITWAKRRLSGETPRYLKIGRRVLYRWSDVKTWLDGCVRTSTSDAA